MNVLRSGLKELPEAHAKGLGVVTARYLISNTRFRIRPNCVVREVRTTAYRTLASTPRLILHSTVTDEDPAHSNATVAAQAPSAVKEGVEGEAVLC